MTSRTLVPLALLACVVVGTIIGLKKSGSRDPIQDGDPEDAYRRVVFICCEDFDNPRSYSPAIYLRSGGGRSAFRMVREAAPYLSSNNPGGAAAGLCAWLFKEYRYEGDTEGTMSLDPPPAPGADGKVDWDAYCMGGGEDVLLINVKTGTVRCCYGIMAGEEVRGLRFGYNPPDKP